MCNPAAFAVATMVISVATTAVSQYQASKAADAADAAAQREAKYAEEAEKNQLEALTAQMEQATDKTEVQKLDRQRQALRERAKIRVAASESGGMGNVVLKQLSASMMQEGYDTGIMDYNLKATGEQIERQKKATKTSTKRQINSAFANVPIGPSTWMQGLNLTAAGASGAMSGYATGKSVA